MLNYAFALFLVILMINTKPFLGLQSYIGPIIGARVIWSSLCLEFHPGIKAGQDVQLRVQVLSFSTKSIVQNLNKGLRFL